eukprot:COSAG03_NODE_7899_length_858_cov_1.347826_1_plen_175_part_00
MHLRSWHRQPSVSPSPVQRAPATTCLMPRWGLRVQDRSSRTGRHATPIHSTDTQCPDSGLRDGESLSPESEGRSEGLLSHGHLRTCAEDSAESPPSSGLTPGASPTQAESACATHETCRLVGPRSLLLPWNRLPGVQRRKRHESCGDTTTSSVAGRSHAARRDLGAGAGHAGAG